MTRRPDEAGVRTKVKVTTVTRRGSGGDAGRAGEDVPRGRAERGPGEEGPRDGDADGEGRPP